MPSVKRLDPKNPGQTSIAELRRRHRVVEDMIVNDKQMHEIVDECHKRWGVSLITVHRYARAVRDQWAEERALTRDSEHAATVVRLSRLAKHLQTKEAYGPLMSCEKLLADVRGLKAPEKHDVRVAAVNVQPRASLEALAPVLERASDSFLAELVELARTRRANPHPMGVDASNVIEHPVLNPALDALGASTGDDEAEGE